MKLIVFMAMIGLILSYSGIAEARQQQNPKGGEEIDNKSKKPPPKRYNDGVGTVMSLLPFGAGQYYYNRPVVGTISLVAQSGVFGMGIYLLRDASNFQKNVDQICSNPDHHTWGDKPREDRWCKRLEGGSIEKSPEFEQWQRELNRKREFQNGFLIAGLVLWGVGSIESLINRPRAHRRAEVGNPLLPNIRDMHLVDLEGELLASRTQHVSQWDFGLGFNSVVLRWSF